MKIRIEAKIAYEFDTEDGPCSDVDEAAAEVARLVEEGVDFEEFDVTVEVTG